MPPKRARMPQPLLPAEPSLYVNDVPIAAIPTTPILPIVGSSNPTRIAPPRPANPVVKAPAGTVVGPGTPSTLPMIGWPPARPAFWTTRLQGLDYMPALRIPQLRLNFTWRPARTFPELTGKKRSDKESASSRADEAWMAQERGFLAPTPCDQCQVVSKSTVSQPFVGCVYIYVPIGPKDVWFLRGCVNCLVGDNSSKCSRRVICAANRDLKTTAATNINLAADAEDDYQQYLATLAVYNQQQMTAGNPNNLNLPLQPVAKRSHVGAGPVPPPITGPATSGQFSLNAPWAGMEGRTGVGPARNPRNTRTFLIARLIRPVDEGSGAIITSASQSPGSPAANFNMQDPNFEVNYGDYLLHLGDVNRRSLRMPLMRNYAGQHAFVPSGMLQDIPNPWGLADLTFAAPRVSLGMAFLRWRVTTDLNGFDSPSRSVWSDQECVHNAANATADEEWDSMDNDRIIDVEGDYATISVDDTAGAAPADVTPMHGIDDDLGIDIISRPFLRPWNIMVNSALLVEKSDEVIRLIDEKQET